MKKIILFILLALFVAGNVAAMTSGGNTLIKNTGGFSPQTQ